MSIKRLAAAPLPLLLALAACTTDTAAPEPQPPAAAPKPAAAPAPMPKPLPPQPQSWLDAPQTAGDWSYVAEAGQTASVFRAPDGGAVFSLTCDRNGRALVLSRSGAVGAAGVMRILTTSDSVALDARTDSGTPSPLSTRIAASHPILEAMAFSRGRFAIESPSLPTLYLPSSPEVTRVIEDCR